MLNVDKANLEKYSESKILLIATFSLLLFLSLSFFLSYKVFKTNEKNIKNILERESLEIVHELKQALNRSFNAVHRMSERLNVNEEIDNKLLKRDSENYLEDNSELVSVTIIKIDGSFDCHYFKKGYQMHESDVALLLQKDAQSFMIDETKVYLIQDTDKMHKLFWLHIPVKKDSILLVAYSYQKLLDHIYKLSEEEAYLNIELIQAKQKVALSGVMEMDKKNNLIAHKKLESFEPLEIFVRAIPKNKFIEKHTSKEYLYLFFLLLLMSVFLSLSIYLKLVSDREQIKSSISEKSLLIKTADVLKIQQRVHSMMEISPTGLMILDDSYNVIDINKTVLKYFQLDKKFIMNHNFSELIDINQEPFRGDLNTYFGEDHQDVFDIELKRKDKKEFYVEISFVQFENERKKQFLLNLNDINHRIAAQEMMNQAIRETREIAKAKEHFLANMSHEIRTPMNGILGTSQLLLETNLSEEQKDLSTMILHSSKSLLVIINDILDFSKIQSGKLYIEEISFDYLRIVKDVFQLMQGQVNGKEIDFSYKFPELYPELILGDPTRIRQVLLNLVSNALKFTPSGSVTIEVTFDKIEGDRFNLITKVSDTGIGMKPKQLDKIFDSFTQADSSTTRLYGGTGLGTTISKKLIELMNGTITVKSEVEKGSEFSFSIPVKRSEVKYVNKEKADFPERNYQKKILLVEDNLINRKIATKLMEKLGLLLDTAKDGKEGVEKARAYEYDLILMDIQMPIMNGMQATKVLLDEGYQKPIIAMTANVMEDDVSHYMQLGMLDHIGKPIDMHQLVSVLDKYLRIDSTSS